MKTSIAFFGAALAFCLAGATAIRADNLNLPQEYREERVVLGGHLAGRAGLLRNQCAPEPDRPVWNRRGEYRRFAYWVFFQSAPKGRRYDPEQFSRDSFLRARKLGLAVNRRKRDQHVRAACAHPVGMGSAAGTSCCCAA